MPRDVPGCVLIILGLRRACTNPGPCRSPIAHRVTRTRRTKNDRNRGGNKETKLAEWAQDPRFATDSTVSAAQIAAVPRRGWCLNEDLYPLELIRGD